MRMRVRGFYHFFPRGKASAFEALQGLCPEEFMGA
jgi:hypothetical protein